MYKCGDKVVIKIDKLDATSLNKEDNVAFYNEQILGKLEDFTPAEEKIKMTVEEKKEFDRLGLAKDNTDYYDSMDTVRMCGALFPNLHKRLFSGNTTNDKQSQSEFVRALEKPSLIEVEKEKKYYVHLFKSQECGYLNQVKDSLELKISDFVETNFFKTEFTKDEIKNLKDLGFKINDDALEEVEDE